MNRNASHPHPCTLPDNNSPSLTHTHTLGHPTRLSVPIEEALLALDLKLRSWPTGAATDENHRYFAALIKILPLPVQWVALHLKRLRAQHFLSRQAIEYQNSLNLLREAIHAQAARPFGLKLTCPKRYEFPNADAVLAAKAELLTLLAALIECNTLVKEAGGKGQSLADVRDEAASLLQKILAVVRGITPSKKEPTAESTGADSAAAASTSTKKEATHVTKQEVVVVPSSNANGEPHSASASVSAGEVVVGQGSSAGDAAGGVGVVGAVEDPLLIELRNTPELISVEDEYKSSGGVVLNAFREMIGAAKRILAKWKETSGLKRDTQVNMSVTSLLSACVMCARGATMFEQQIQQDRDEAEIEAEIRRDEEARGIVSVPETQPPTEPGVVRALVWDVESKQLVGVAEKAFMLKLQSEIKYQKFLKSYETMSLGKSSVTLPNAKEARVKMANALMALAPRGVLISRQSMSRVITSLHKREKATTTGGSGTADAAAAATPEQDGNAAAAAGGTKKKKQGPGTAASSAKSKVCRMS
jgi:hypothetical protein